MGDSNSKQHLSCDDMKESFQNYNHVAFSQRDDSSVDESHDNKIESGGQPADGFYTDPGVKDGRFYPEKAGTGIHKISYTVNDQVAFDFIEVTGPKKKAIDPNCAICNGTGKD